VHSIKAGPELSKVLEIAYRSRRPVLVEGPTGVGKSEIIRSTAAHLHLQCVTLDLSLLEPPDLVGLPSIVDGRTTYNTPTILPKDGNGVLLLEELNRSERYMQQPALQLLTTGRLHEYSLPPGWLCVAATNPADGNYQVNALDPALIARFMHLRVEADRGTWLHWAERQKLEPSVISLVRTHHRALEQVSPRSWTYVAQVLSVLTPQERQDQALLTSLFTGYLPDSWAEVLLQELSTVSADLGIDVRSVLAEFAPHSAAAVSFRALRDSGRADAVDEFVQRLRAVLRSPEVASLHAAGAFDPSAFEALLAELGGDARELLQAALSENPVAAALMDTKAVDVLSQPNAAGAAKKLALWTRNPSQRYRVDTLIAAIVAHLKQHTRATDYRQNNVLRSNLGLVLSAVTERSAMPLVHALLELGITPIRPR
jgi:hypothetical protein